MRKILILAGEPATGKTTLMRDFLGSLNEQGAPVHFGKVRALWFRKNQVFVLGIYDEQVFSGTDRLSMNVITDALKFLEHMKTREDMKGASMVFEGDRLVNSRYIQACKDVCPTEIMVLRVSEEEKARRHDERLDKQTPSWLKSRKTKIENLLLQFPEATVRSNENEEQRRANLSWMVKRVFPERFSSQAQNNN
jgi:hypothetical protein